MFYCSTIEADGETKIGSSIMVYTNEEPDKETLFIAGPTEEDLILYVSFKNLGKAKREN
jgi:hypothetical protein